MDDFRLLNLQGQPILVIRPDRDFRGVLHITSRRELWLAIEEMQRLADWFERFRAETARGCEPAPSADEGGA